MIVHPLGEEVIINIRRIKRQVCELAARGEVGDSIYTEGGEPADSPRNDA